MLQCSDVYTYQNKQNGVTRDGEKYLALRVIGKNDKKYYSFMTKNQMLIDEINSQQLVDFQDINITVQFLKVFNPETRYTHWECELVGIGRANNYGD